MNTCRIIYFFIFIVLFSCKFENNSTVNFQNQLQDEVDSLTSKYKDETLANFLSIIASEASITFRDLNVEVTDKESISKRSLRIENDSICIIYAEKYYGRISTNTYEMDSTVSALYVNGQKINTENSEYGLLSFGNFDFGASDNTIRSYVINDTTKSYLLKGKSFTSFGHFRDICYGYLIIVQPNKISCINLQSYNVPNDFYIGKKQREYIYLDIDCATRDENVENIYEIIPKSIDFEKGTMGVSQGDTIIVATPSKFDYAQYRIIQPKNLNQHKDR